MAANNYDDYDVNQNPQNSGNNNSAQYNNSSQQRAGNNSTAKSKGDKTGGSNNSGYTESAPESSLDGAEEGAAGDKNDDYLEKKGKEEGKKSAAKAIGQAAKQGFKQGLKQGVNSVIETAKSYMQILKNVPAAIIKTVAAVTTALVASFVAVIVAAVDVVVPTLDPPPEPPITYVRRCMIGTDYSNTNFNAEHSKREMARRVWSVMSAFEKCDDPGGAYYQAADGSNLGAAQRTFGLRPEQICAMLGNWEHESGLDPTAVETVFDEPWTIGTTKQRAIISDFIALKWAVYPDGETGSRYLYFSVENDTIYKSGIGLAQWTDTYDPTVGTSSWDITNPGRNTKLQEYAYLYGKEWYEHIDENFNQSTGTGGDGWNGECWISGNVNTQGLWYDPEVQLAFALDKECEFGDSSAQWLWDWADDANGDGADAGLTKQELWSQNADGEDWAVWGGDIAPNLDDMVDTCLEGWTCEWSRAEGWHNFKVEDDKVTFSGTIGAVGYTTNDKDNFRSGDSTVPGGQTTNRDAYYDNSCGNADLYISQVNYNDFKPEDALNTQLDYDINGTTYGNVNSTYARLFDGSGADTSRKIAFWWAMNSAYACWHGDKIEEDGSVSTGILGEDPDWNDVSTDAGHDFIMENDPRTWTLTHDGDDFHHYYTQAQAYANGISALRVNCSTVGNNSHSHGSGCDSDGDGVNDCNNSPNNTHVHVLACYTAGYVYGSTHTHTEGESSSSLSNPANAANDLAKRQFKRCFAYMYRYHLYRYQTMFYTAQFVAEYEGVPGNGLESRFPKAIKWFNMWWKAGEDGGPCEPNVYARDAETMTSNGFDDKFFLVEQAYAQGIMLGIDRTQDEIPDTFKEMKFYNYDLLMANGTHKESMNRTNAASTACLIAVPDKPNSYVSSCTDYGIDYVYKYIHDAVIPGDTIYASCDRTVCTAVRWAGFDDNFPAGATLQQEEYLVSSPRWVEVDWGGNVNMLMPGDVLIRTDSLIPGSGTTISDGSGSFASDRGEHHIIIYVGDYLPSALYHEHWGMENDPTADLLEGTANIVHGSFNERVPAYDKLTSTGNSIFRSYHAFRCIDMMDTGKSKYVGYHYDGTTP